MFRLSSTCCKKTSRPINKKISLTDLSATNNDSQEKHASLFTPIVSIFFIFFFHSLNLSLL